MLLVTRQLLSMMRRKNTLRRRVAVLEVEPLFRRVLLDNDMAGISNVG